MNSEKLGYEGVHLKSESATDPIEPPERALVALLILAGRSLLRRRALPVHPLTVHSGLSNCGF